MNFRICSFSLKFGQQLFQKCSVTYSFIEIKRGKTQTHSLDALFRVITVKEKKLRLTGRHFIPLNWNYCFPNFWSPLKYVGHNLSWELEVLPKKEDSHMLDLNNKRQENWSHGSLVQWNVHKPRAWNRLKASRRQIFIGKSHLYVLT